MIDFDVLAKIIGKVNLHEKENFKNTKNCNLHISHLRHDGIGDASVLIQKVLRGFHFYHICKILYVMLYLDCIASLACYYN